MEEINDINLYASIMIYPDGHVEKIEKDSRIFHMEYLIGLINKSQRLKKIIRDNNLYIPDNKLDIQCTLTTEYDKEITKNGIIILYNILIDDPMEYDDTCDTLFHVKLPAVLTDTQKIILSSIMNNFEMSNSYYGIYQDNKIVDIEYGEVQSLTSNKTK